MSRYTAPEGTEVSTTLPGGEEARVEFKKAGLDVTDEGLDFVLQRLADDRANPIRHAKKTKEE